MKRIISVVLALMCMLALCSCEKDATYDEKREFLDGFGVEDNDHIREDEDYEEIAVYLQFTSTYNGDSGDTYYDRVVYYETEKGEATVREIVEFVLDEEGVYYEYASYGGTLNQAFDKKAYGEINDEYAAAGMWTCYVNGDLASADTIVEDDDEILYEWVENYVDKQF